MRWVVFGNSGAGKSRFARALAAAHGLAHLDLDTVAWQDGADPPSRRPLAASAAAIRAFQAAAPGWVVEGCYADLLALALAQADEAVFLNPGTAACQANARQRPWEPHKYPSPQAQDANLAMLLDWIADYETRADEFSLAAHRALFDGFAGRKRELRDNAAATRALAALAPGHAGPP